MFWGIFAILATKALITVSNRNLVTHSGVSQRLLRHRITYVHGALVLIEYKLGVVLKFRLAWKVVQNALPLLDRCLRVAARRHFYGFH